MADIAIAAAPVDVAVMNAQVSPQTSMRPMRQADIDTVAAIERVAYSFPWTAGIFRDCLRAGYQCWVLEQAQMIIGYSVLSTAASEAHLLNICIAPALQGKGHGRKLLRRMIDLARWHMSDRVFLEVRPSNPKAIALYQDEGFNEIGLRPRYYPANKGREDAIVMAIELLAPE